MTQIELHKKIDEITQVPPNESLLNFVKELVTTNDSAYKDARRYFFSKADERWLDWLWQNGLLDAIKQKSADPTKYSYTLPELDYLARMAIKEGQKVVDIILAVDMSINNFNPQVVDRFLWICSELPAIQISRLVDKIRGEEWVKLMAPFNKWGFEYEKMFKRLVEAIDYNAILILAEAILVVRPKAEREMNNAFSDNPFYINDLDRMEIFQYLASVDAKHVEPALKLALDTLEDVMVSGNDKSDVFDVKENYYLYDVDFFTINFSSKNNYSLRENVHDLACVATKLVERLIGKNCGEIEKNIYEKYIVSLPNSQSFWHLRLFVWSLCPEMFKDELKVAFFNIFEHGEKYYSLFSAEYSHALKKAFSILEESDRQKYVKQVFEYFGQKRSGENEEKIYKRDGWRILSCVFDYLTKEEKNAAKETFGEELNGNFEPSTGYGPVRSGMVHNRAPENLEDYTQKPVSEVVKLLCSELTPVSLYNKYKNESFFDSVNAEGVGNWLQQNVIQRPKEYLDSANLFFQKGVLDEHYTYSFLHGINEIIRKDDYDFSLELDKILDLFDTIRISCEDNVLENTPRQENHNTGWLVNWEGVHNEIADVIKLLLTEKHGKNLIDFDKNRNRLISLIEFLLNNQDPDLSGENIENGSDPFSHAINSVRGRAFESLALFVYLDGKKYSKDATSKIDEDVKKVYERLLEREKTVSVLFLFGHYLPTFYYRDKIWVRKLFDKIFPTTSEKFDLFIATFEGYLSTNLYEELFEDLVKTYERVINLTPSQYPKRRYFKELDEGLAIHLALAYVHFPKFDHNSPLFQLFWQTQNIKRHEEFVSFIGRYLISNDDPKIHGVEVGIMNKKLGDLWDLILNHANENEASVFAYFGFWISEKQAIFTDLKWLAGHLQKSLEKSGGDIEWEHNVIKVLPAFAEVAPEETLKILELYLMYQASVVGYFGYSDYIDSISMALKILWAKLETKIGVEKLINDLLVKGSSRFWDLKKVLE